MAGPPPVKRRRDEGQKPPVSGRPTPARYKNGPGVRGGQEQDAADAWRAKENEFVLEQAKLRASIRAVQGRTKPIDILVLTLLWSRSEDIDEEDDAALEVHLAAPDQVIDSLGENDDTIGDVKVFLESETDPESLAYWREILSVSSDTRDSGVARVDASITSEIDSMFAGKSPDELDILDSSIRAKLNSGEPLDVEYWEAVLRRIMTWKSRSRLRKVHAAALEYRISRLRQAQRDEGRWQQEDLQGIQYDMSAQRSTEWSDDMEPAVRQADQLSYEESRLKVTTLDEFHALLTEARRRISGMSFVPRTTRVIEGNVAEDDTVSDAMYRRESERPLEAEEEAFDDAVNVSTTYQWSERYRPRKPRYVNRVNTGYEWNRYNQTHYDQDNPPPRVVQGYRFNIFYPDLIDSTKAPSYKLIREPPESGCGDTVILRFSAGPPYEDVAFRIVDRPWEHSKRRGFRCIFERGVLQLYFNFKRLRYRK